MKYLLVVMTAATSCTIDNIDSTTESVIVMPDMQTCQSAADQLDPLLRVRAFCVEVQP